MERREKKFMIRVLYTIVDLIVLTKSIYFFKNNNNNNKKEKLVADQLPIK